MPEDYSAISGAEQGPEATPDANANYKTVCKAYEQLKEARSYRSQYDKDWVRYYLLYAGQHWDGRQAEWQATPVINMVFSVIQTIVPILTDGRPQITIIPRQPEHEHIASVVGSLVEWLWEYNNLDILLPKVMLNTLIFGNGFMKVLWDQEVRGGEGDISVIPVDPVNIFLSPHARTLEESEYVIHAENLPRSVVERIYNMSLNGDSGTIEQSLSVERNITNQQAPGSGEGGTMSVRSTDGSSVNSYYRGSVSDNSKTADLVTVLERWERKADGSIWQTVCVNETLIKDEPSPFEHNRFPFVHFVDHPHTWSAWAMGEVQQVEKLQMEINRRRGHLIDILRYTANPMLIVDPAAAPDWEAIVPRPNLIIPVEGGPQSAGWLQPASIPSALFQINEMDKADFDIVLGNVDVLQGRRPAGIEAGVAIEMLQEAANVRMRLKVRNMENSIKRLGELLVKMIQKYYNMERVFRVAGNDSMKLEKPVTQDGAQYLTINQPMSGGFDAMGQPQVEMQNAIPPVTEAEFDVRIGVGSTLPVSRSTQFQKVITLFQMGIVDDEEVLKNSGLPHWEDVLVRSRMYKQMMMAQQAQMMGPSVAAPAEGEPTEGEIDDEIAAGAPAEFE